MASKEEIKKLIQEKGPLVSTEGATTSVTMSDGSVITGVPYNADIGVSARTGKKLFQSDDGGFSMTEPTKTTISLDKDTGKITIKAPSFITNRDSFKTDYVNVLKTYSENYKIDKNRRYVDYENDASEGKTTEEVLAEMQDSMNSAEFIQNARAIQDKKDTEQAKTGYSFSDDDIIRMSTVALGPDAKDDTAQVIPLDIDTSVFSTYNPETGAVQLGDLREHFYNREVKSDEELLKMYSRYSEYVENGYENDTSEEAKERYLRAKAFVDFMDGRSPDVGFIRGFGDAISQFMYGAASTAAELEALVADLFTGATGIREWSNTNTVLAETLKVEAEHERKSKFLNANSYAFNVLGEIAVHIVNSIAAGQIAEGAVSGVTEGVKGALASKIGAASLNAATGLSEAADTAVKTSKAIQMATEAYLWLSSGTKAANIVNTAVGVLGTVASAVSESLASGVLEAVVNNPALFEKVLSSGQLTDEAKSSVMEEFAWNVGGWAAGLTLGEALLKFGETLPGRVLSDNLAIINAKIQTKTGEISDAIKVKFSKYDTIDELIANIPKAEKKRAGELKRVLRWKLGELATEEPIQAIGKNSDEINEALKRVDSKIIEIRNANNAITDFQASVGRTLNSWFVKNLGWRQAYTNVTDKFNAVVDAEKAAGIASSAKNASDIGVEGRLFSQVTTNYIGAVNEKVRVDWLIKNQGETPELLKASEDISSKIAEFRKIAPKGSELDNAVGEFIIAQRAAYYQMTNMFIRPDMGLENKAEIEYYRSTGQWGTDGADYAYAMRKGELSEIQIRNKNGTFNTRTFIEDMHYSYGATGDYVDPMLAMQTKLIEHAKVYQRRELYKAFGNTDMVNRVIRVSAEQSEMARIVTPKVRKDFKKAVYQWTRGQSENLIMGGITDLYARMGAGVNAISTGEKATERTKRSLEKIYDKSWNSTIADRTGYILGMSGDEVTDGMDELFGIRSWDDLSYNYRRAPSDLLLDNTQANIPRAEGELFQDITPQTGQTISRAGLKKGNYDAVTSMQKIEDIGSGKLPFNDYIAEQRELLWDSFKQSNGGTETFYIRDDAGKVVRRETVSYNGTLYKQLYSEYGGKPPKYAFNEALDDVLEKGEASKYYAGFKELDPDGAMALDYNKGSEYIDNILVVKNDIAPNAKATTKIDVKKTPAYTRNIEVNVSGKKAPTFSEWELKNKIAQPNIPTGTVGFEDFYQRLDAPARKYVANQMSDFALNYLGRELTDDPVDRAFVFKKMLDEMNNGDDIARGVLANTKSYRDSDWITDLANATKTTNRQAEYALKYNDELEKIAFSMKTGEIDIETAKEQIEILIEDSIGRIINGATTDEDVLTAIKPILAVTGDNLDSTTKSYIILDTMIKNPDGLKAMAYDAIAGGVIKPLEAKEIKALQSQFYDLLIKRVNDIRNNLADQLRAVGSSLPDTEDIFKQVRDTMSEIQGLKAGKNMIIMGDQNGALQYVEVNPLFADLMNTQPVYKEMGKIQKLNYMWSKLWRMGTTSMSLKSLVNQQFKDSINAFVGGGAYHTFKQLAPGLTDVFGADIVEYFRNFEPDNLVYLTKQAEETGETIEKVATEELLNRGKMLSSESLETKAYQLSRETRFDQFINGESEMTRFDKAINKLDDFMNSKFSPNRINDWREGMLRTSVYNNAFASGLKRGYSVEQATIYATQLMDDATTNFTRSMYHLQSLQKTVPYLGAAVNGTKSFWRLASLDPVGVFSRLIGGVAVPVMAVTAMSLASEDDKKVWKNLKEYEKDGNLVFVTNGQVFTIPLPEEISNFVNPFRQVVEGLSGSANHSFWELAANDLIGLSPIDFTGFTQADAYALGKDPTVWDRLGSGTLRIMSQLLPPPLRASATVISGRDLYTGAEIDRTYKEYNPETGEVEVMGDYSGQFAKVLASLFSGQVSAPMIEEIFSQLIGVAGVDTLDILANYGTLALATEDYKEQVGANWLEGLSRPIERITEPLTATPKKDLAQSAWSSAMSQMYDLKTEMANSEEYLGIVKALNDAYATGDQEKIYVANNKKRAFLEPFYQRLKQTVDDLNSKYGTEFTARKYASVISLANFASETSTLGSAYSSQVSKQLYYEGKQQAVATMQRLGFGSADSGIFGWMRTNSAGDTYIDYATPMAILNGENMAYYAQNTFSSNLETQLSSAGITRSAMFGDDYNAAKTDKTALKQYKSAWNTKVVMALAPYVRRYGIDTVLDDTATIDMLDQYIFVDNPYKAKDYIKTIFKGV